MSNKNGLWLAKRVFAKWYAITRPKSTEFHLQDANLILTVLENLIIQAIEDYALWSELVTRYHMAVWASGESDDPRR